MEAALLPRSVPLVGAIIALSAMGCGTSQSYSRIDSLDPATVVRRILLDRGYTIEGSHDRNVIAAEKFFSSSWPRAFLRSDDHIRTVVRIRRTSVRDHYQVYSANTYALSIGGSSRDDSEEIAILYKIARRYKEMVGRPGQGEAK
jgi:hypothetical protein